MLKLYCLKFKAIPKDDLITTKKKEIENPKAVNIFKVFPDVEKISSKQ